MTNGVQDAQSLAHFHKLVRWVRIQEAFAKRSSLQTCAPTCWSPKCPSSPSCHLEQRALIVRGDFMSSSVQARIDGLCQAIFHGADGFVGLGRFTLQGEHWLLKTCFQTSLPYFEVLQGIVEEGARFGGSNFERLLRDIYPQRNVSTTRSSPPGRPNEKPPGTSCKNSHFSLDIMRTPSISGIK